MLEKYKDKQSLFCSEVMNSIQNHKVIHAYLIETNQYSEKDNLILAFIKTLFCSQNSNQSGYLDENICHFIDENTFSDLLIIEPDGAFIKKEQISKIKEKFKTTSINNSFRLYWIKQADKLNKQASNSLLKFLEEPDGNVIAILDVDNRYKVLETIRSRCQIYSLQNCEQKRQIENLDLLIEIVKCFEEKREHAIAYLPIVLENDLRNKEFWNDIFLDMIELYENALRKLLNLSYTEYGDCLNFLIRHNEEFSFLKKINVLFEMVQHLNYNLNIQMMLDQFAIHFCGGD